MLNNFFPVKRRLWVSVEKYGTTRQATVDNIMPCTEGAICMPDNEGKNTDTFS
jgi:hypothetical protein